MSYVTPSNGNGGSRLVSQYAVGPYDLLSGSR